MIAAGGLHDLSGHERTRFMATLRWLAHAAEATDDIALNVPYSVDAGRADRLHIYISKPEYAALTGCAANNALYDPDLDIIFLDRSFVAQEEWKQFLAAPVGGWGLDIPLRPSDVPSINMLLRFVLLHEFGHRQLHGPKARQRTGNARTGSRAETEADLFSIRRMRHAYLAAGQFGITAVEQYTGDLIKYPVRAAMPVDDQVQAALVEMALISLYAQLVLPSVNSPFFTSATHPNLMNRLMGLMLVAQDTYRGEPELQALTRYRKE